MTELSLEKDLIFCDKPAGATTHSSINDREKAGALIDINDGFIESLIARSGASLFVSHRLDRETTGTICFARSAEAAEILREKFESRSVHKRYLFLTDGAAADSQFRVESFIERQGNQFVSDMKSVPNAYTELRKLGEKNGVSLWEAKPETGRPHQIRLHANQVGIPILGDTAHGGSAFPALCLHSQELSLGQLAHSSPPPIWFENLDLVRDVLLCRWLSAVDRRLRLLRSWNMPEVDSERTLRWIHTEGDPLRVEQLGSVCSLSWFKDREPSQNEWLAIEKLAALCKWEKWYLQVRGNRGRAPLEEHVKRGPVEFPQRWQASEDNLKFEFRTDSGLSPGLFLDQRQNRKWVRANSLGKRVLNLFCYTGGFSVAAVSGGASQVVSVDVSKVFLEWAKVNFALNRLPIEGHEFRAMDSREYLTWAKKKSLTFDIVICDPPSFSRSKSGLFKIENDFDELLTALYNVTAPQGRILFASNYEGWDELDLEKRAREVLRKFKGARMMRTPSPDWDFEVPGRTRNMKSFFVSRTE
jgi:23S rRNA (cytosine1962-C5)-methyltransferase